MNKELIKSFIDKWNVGYEDRDQKAEFAADMEADLMDILQSAQVTNPRTPKEEAEMLHHELGHFKSISVVEYTITALQLRGLSTQYEEEVLTILKGM